MLRKIRKILLVFVIVILILGSLPFLTKKKVNLHELDDEYRRLQEAKNDHVSAKIISHPNEALASRIALIEAATTSIDISYYRMNPNDESTRIYFGALLDAAKRGVKINIVVDAKFGGFNKKTVRLLNSEPNISVYYYNPINVFDPESIQVSLHNKLMLVDNKYIITGGRNISDTFMKDIDEYNNVSYDLDVLVLASEENDIIKDAQGLFLEILNKDYSVIKTNLPNKKTPEHVEETISMYKNYTDHEHYLENVQSEMIEVDKIKLIYSSLAPENKEPYVAEIMYQIAKQTDGDIIIQTPYAIGDKLILNALDSLSEDHKVTLLTNSLASSPNYPAFSNYLLHRKKFLNTDTTLFEYMSDGTHSVHTKAYALSDRIVGIGSMNLDNRSLFINSEQMLLIESDEFMEEYLSLVNAQIEDSVQVSKDLKTHKKNYEKDVSFFKRFLMKLTSIVLRPFQSLL